MMASDSEPKTVAGDVAAEATTESSAAQRQRAYRQRRKRAAIEAIGEEASASRVALLTLLGQDLAALEARATPANMIGPTRSSVRRILNAIVTRYEIEL
jgi:hypothetical protein